MKFSASLDTLSKIITVFITLIFLFVFVVSFFSYTESAHLGLWIPPAFLGVIYLVVFIFRPIHYNVTDTHFTIVRTVGNLTFAKAEIQSIERLEKSHLKWSLRTFGVGGMFGYFGKFYNKGIGRMKWFLTRRDTAVMIKLKEGKNIVLSPNDPDLFVQKLKN